MWRAGVEWLRRVETTDPVDRRNAPFFQLLMLMMGTLVVLNWAYLQFVVGLPRREGGMVDVAMSLVTAAVAWCSFALVRRGRFRLAVKLYLWAEVATQLIAYAAVGLRGQLSDPTIPVLMVVLGGLMLGRRTLWLMFGLLMAIFAAGALTDASRYAADGEPWVRGISSTPHIVLRYLVITVIIDRCVAALRESLDASVERGRTLARLNEQLRHEMAERERAQSQLIHAQKMEAVGRLAGGIAHDFNHVLSVVLGYAGQRERLAANGEGALLRAMEGIETAARRGAAICRKLLGFSREDVVNAELFDAGQALRELQPMLHQLFDASPIEIALEVDPAAMPIRFDRGQFDLMVLNIAANARDAMPGGGRFGIRAAALPDGGAEIVLSDDGHGMTAQVCRRIFEPFYTTKSAGNGTGLGLSIVHDLLQQAGGSIAVDSAPEQGTVFRIRLPAAMADDAALAACTAC
jgi:signal transduction histidine kinase